MKTSENIIIRFDGPILVDHRMDISDLAPALIGISELCKIANSKFNDEKASVKVLMKADIEQKCIQLDLNVVLSTWDSIKGLISDNEIKSAKELLEWIGIIGGPVFGAIKLSSYLKNKKLIQSNIPLKMGKT